MPGQADYKVEIVDDSGQADMTVAVVGDQVVDLTGATDGEVLTVQADGTVAPETPAADPAAVPKSLYDANTVLKADTDNTPAALTMGASTILARLAAGVIKAATPAEIKTLLAIAQSDVTDLVTDLAAKAPANRLLRIHALDEPAASSVTWSINQNASYYGGLTLANTATGTQNDSVDFDISLTLGTYTFHFWGFGGTGRGIATLQLADVAADGTVGSFNDIGTVDLYNVASVVVNGSITGVAVATTGAKRLRIIAKTKNASSSGYAIYMSYIGVRRTA